MWNQFFPRCGFVTRDIQNVVLQSCLINIVRKIEDQINLFKYKKAFSFPKLGLDSLMSSSY
jgi:hypothetical protein